MLSEHSRRFRTFALSLFDAYTHLPFEASELSGEDMGRFCMACGGLLVRHSPYLYAIGDYLVANPTRLAELTGEQISVILHSMGVVEFR